MFAPTSVPLDEQIRHSVRMACTRMLDVETCVRPARADDWPDLWPLLMGMGVREAEQQTRERFLRLAEESSWFIAVAAVGDRLLGYVAAQDYGDHLRGGKEGRVARLHDLYVQPAARNAGVGRLLMQAVVSWASDRARYLQWQAHQSRAAPFYERLGYRGSPCPQPDYPEFEITF
jgi:GNAT superfamily N-acetyltransferase